MPHSVSNPGPSDDDLISLSQNTLLGECLSPFANSETKAQTVYQKSKWRRGPWVQAVRGTLSLKHFKSSIKDKSPLYYHRILAILNIECHNQLYAMREAVRPQPQNRSRAGHAHQFETSQSTLGLFVPIRFGISCIVTLWVCHLPWLRL